MQVKDVENRKYAAAERLAKRRRKRRRVAVLLFSFLILVIVTLWILSITVFFPITSVSVSGNTFYEAETVINNSEIKAGDKLFGVSERKARNTLTVKLPYIKTVELKRNLFDNIEIVITETNDAFCYYQNGVYYTADTDNKILNSYSSKPERIAEILVGEIPEISIGYTLDIGKENLDLANSVYKILTRADIVIDSLDITNTSAITAKIEGRFSVNFGTMQDIESKTEHLRAMISEITANNGEDSTGKINLSVWTSKKREGYFEPTSNY